ncbi:helix-turn-helix domain-containing protein [Gracilibacillus sp. S3-1-1]|uniref:Helix-turn-helix domain-containing protein n=1 Tax=Gracilibacillus pellucidus TaxID=3095368 RepID=A0ACC6M6B7_9BACI|nr:helix-turn-helix domain-containing protein [Gracilibacillus sp. S3-1-1]MDX8046382.1 helix-turn-helix domain-containing protein [Gracilibacillus sp. S3-1-1]
MDTKAQIMNTALQLFSDNGYNETSVQQIAQLAGISKGGFYNHFSSKRELMLEMIDQHHAKMTHHSQCMEKSNHHLATYIQYELEEWLEHETFIHVVFNEFHPNKDPQITKKMDELHITLVKQHREILYLYYGEKIQPYLTDIVIILEGMLKEYLLYKFVHQAAFDIEKLSLWICHHLDSIVDNLDKMDPFLQDETSDTIEAVLQNIKTAIEQDIVKGKDQLLQVFELLDQEIAQKASNSIHAEVYLHYLKKEKTIQTDVFKLERLIQQGGK